MGNDWVFRDEHMLRVLSPLSGAVPEALARARVEKKRFCSQALIEGGVLAPELVIRASEAAFKARHVPLASAAIDKFTLSLVPEKICRKYLLVPLRLEESEIQAVMMNPSDFNAQSDVEAITGRRVIPFFGLPREIEACLDRLYSADAVVFDLLSKVETPDDIMVLGERAQAVQEDSSISSPVIQLVNSIISQAYRKRSSDIHIEHEEQNSHVRIRIDGDLRNILKLPRPIAAGPIVSRIKIMSDLDVSNHMRPQDGRTKIRIGAAEVGLRVSTLPTSYGEKVVMRILDQRAAEVPFEKLGFAPEVAAELDKCMTQTQGVLLITGPTGSGKTTTLYSILNKVKNESNNVVTAEDPIEYKLPGINQVQVNEKQGLTFASVLRSVLRQDPDIIMLGEIRDHETADIALQAAMTGHLVLSTLHTNDTVSTLARLVDMGVDRFKISPGLLAVTAQRLVRRLCPKCREQVAEGEADKVILQVLGEYGFRKAYYRAKGCQACEKTGYSGRTSIVELLMADAKVKELINYGATAEEITKTAVASGALRTMTKDALWHLAQGDTDLPEIEPYLKLAKPAAPSLLQDSQPAAMPVQAAAPASAPARRSSQQGKPRIMVADDDQIMRMLLKKFIENSGYEAVEAVDGEDALTKIAEGPAPDLLVSDVNMPKMNGFDLVKGVRETLGLLDLPVIMLTTESADKSQELAFELGADDYVVKPFKGPLVMARITAALRRAGRLG
ncbi:MAG: type II/IV secretion system protein [Elusimicrobia bacterium]|nr:type II/IV secretion system protein [Elusimicrobiota bacterium]